MGDAGEEGADDNAWMGPRPSRENGEVQVGDAAKGHAKKSPTLISGTLPAPDKLASGWLAGKCQLGPIRVACRLAEG